jgi:Ser/Thr protein kinase RdoA (MazF antagonist)
MDNETVDRTFAPAARAALNYFPIEPEDLALVSLSENVTFKVTDARDGRAYVLRLHRPGYHTLEELNSERAWISALADAGIDVPSRMSARDGRDYVPVTIPSIGERRFAGIVGWSEGRLLHEVLAETADQKVVEAYFARLGAITAAMHNQASAWRAPPGFTRHALDSDGLMGEAPHWGPFWDHRSLSDAERRLLIDVRGRMHDTLNRLSRDPSVYSLIHADMHPGNVVADGDRLTVIDFDDAGFGWHQYDIATALTHWQTKPNAAAIERAFLTGYRGTRPVPDEALSLIPTFRLIRWMATIGWFHQRPELDRPASVFDERKAWVLEQCAALQRGGSP